MVQWLEGIHSLQGAICAGSLIYVLFWFWVWVRLRDSRVYGVYVLTKAIAIVFVIASYAVSFTSLRSIWQILLNVSISL